jgi:small subunit ribosomal protein S17
MEKKRKTRVGRVVSNKMNKTVVVAVETLRHHPLYKKTIKGVVKFKAHDENNECGLGDIVRIVETRPLSRQKRWRVAEIITRGEAVEVQPKEITEIVLE